MPLVFWAVSKYLIQYPYESRPLPKIRRIDGLQSHPQNRIIGESPGFLGHIWILRGSLVYHIINQIWMILGVLSILFLFLVLIPGKIAVYTHSTNGPTFKLLGIT